MMKTIRLLLRGAVADAAEEAEDANAVAILRQQIRDAAVALVSAKRELAVAMSLHAADLRALGDVAGRIEGLTDGARKALADGREDLVREAAALIAALSNERDERQEAASGFAAEIERLKAMVADGVARLSALDRGFQAARAGEAVRRAGIDGQRVACLSSGALGEAERTLLRLRERHRRDDDMKAALVRLDDHGRGGIEARLEAEGYGRRRIEPQAVLESLKTPA